MPQNMQKKPKVARLDVEEQAEADYIDDFSPSFDPETLPEDDPRYVAVLELVKHGHNPKKIVKALTERELVASRGLAMRLTMRVIKEHPEEQRTNAYIQFGVAGFTAIIALLFILPPILSTGTLTPSPAYLIFIISAWFVYKGRSTLKGANAKK